jgi:phage head maturation protease
MPFDAPRPGFGLKKVYGSISKVDTNDDGTITVYGIASSGARDSAGEIVASDAMKAALPDYSKFPALREMHQPLAAGRVIEAETDDEGVTKIAALVVDPTAILKVQTGVYAGFSIGGKVTKRDPGDRTIITGLRLVEISLVDSPCNPDAVLSMWKADMSNFIPEADAVVARAKKLADTAGTKKFRDFLFEAREELISEEILKGEALDADVEGTILGVDDGTTDFDTTVVEEPKAAAAEVVAEPVAEAPVVEAVVETPDEDDNAGEGAVDEIAPETGKEAAAEADAIQQAPNPADALTQALAAAEDAAKAASAPVEEPVAEKPLFEDFEKLVPALKGIAVGRKAVEGEDAEKAAEAFADRLDLEKGLYSVSRFAELLQSLCYLQSSISYENEGDGSTVAADLGEKVKELGALLVQYAAEEVAELVSNIASDPVVEVIYCGDNVEASAAVVDLVKADAELMEKATARTAARVVADEPTSKVDGEPDPVALAAENEMLRKSLEDAPAKVEEITKTFTEANTALRTELDELKKRFDEMPAPAKTAGPAVLRVVSKAKDSEGGSSGGGGPEVSSEDFRKAVDELPEAERGAMLLKYALANPKLIENLNR